jgi:hypothetical protein
MEINDDTQTAYIKIKTSMNNIIFKRLVNLNQLKKICPVIHMMIELNQYYDDIIDDKIIIIDIDNCHIELFDYIFSDAFYYDSDYKKKLSILLASTLEKNIMILFLINIVDKYSINLNVNKLVNMNVFSFDHNIQNIAFQKYKSYYEKNYRKESPFKSYNDLIIKCIAPLSDKNVITKLFLSDVNFLRCMQINDVSVSLNNMNPYINDIFKNAKYLIFNQLANNLNKIKKDEITYYGDIKDDNIIKINESLHLSHPVTIINDDDGLDDAKITSINVNNITYGIEKYVDYVDVFDACNIYTIYKQNNHKTILRKTILRKTIETISEFSVSPCGNFVAWCEVFGNESNKANILMIVSNNILVANCIINRKDSKMLFNNSLLWSRVNI